MNSPGGQGDTETLPHEWQGKQNCESRGENEKKLNFNPNSVSHFFGYFTLISLVGFPDYAIYPSTFFKNLIITQNINVDIVLRLSNCEDNELEAAFC